MKVLVIGFGSIGKRHVRNLLDIKTVKSIYVVTKIKPKAEFKKQSKITFTNSYNHKVDFAIVANQTHKHIKSALTLAQNKIPLLIEKPVSHNLKEIKSLSRLVKKHKIPVLIAYNLRFMPVFNKIKDLLNKKALGMLYFAHIEVGQYLPDWRPGTDYSKSYSAIKERGGGVSLDLSHEIDYMRHLFGSPVKHKIYKEKVSQLKINSDDIFKGTYQFSTGFLCHIHLDYLQIKKQRFIRIVGSKGELFCDLAQGLLKLNTQKNKKQWTSKKLFDLNKTYKDELKHLIDVVNKKDSPKISLNDGIAVLELLKD